MSLQICAQVMSVRNFDSKPDAQGVITSYTVVQLLSVNHRPDGAVDWDFHSLFLEGVSADSAWVGQVVMVPVRAYTDKRTNLTKLSPVDGAKPTFVTGAKSYVQIAPEYLPKRPDKAA